MMGRFCLCLFLIISLLCKFVLSDCSKIEKSKGIKFAEAIDCIESVPYSSTIQRETMKSVLTIYDIRNSSGPYQISSTIEEMFEEIQKKTYPNDFRFHEAVQHSFMTLYDPHTVYIPPLCYSTFQYVLPFPIKRVGNDIIVDSYVGDDIEFSIKYKQLYPGETELNMNKYKGYKVSKIFGTDAIPYLNWHSEVKNFYSRDKGVRFNQVLKEEWHKRSMTRNVLPDVDYIEYTLQNSTGGEITINVKWMIIPKLEYRFQKMKKICGLSDGSFRDAFDLNSRRDINVKHIDDIFDKHDRIDKKRRGVTETNTNLDPSYEELKLEYGKFDYFNLYHKKNTNIAVLKVKTFMPEISMDSATDITDPYSYYFLSLDDAFQQMKKRGIRKLVLDMRGNPGGIGCLVFVVAKYVSEYTPLDGSPNSELLVTDLGKGTHCGLNIIDKINYYNQKRKPVGTGWYSKKGENRVFGGRESKYSEMIHWGCQLALILAGVDYLWEDPPMAFEPEDILILTDGTCGSACGIFSKLFQYLNLGRIVTQGGRDGMDIAVSSFKAGAVKTLNITISEIMFSRTFCTGNEDLVLDPFPSSAILSYAFLQIYPWDPKISAFELEKVNDTMPMGFTKKIGDFHINSWDFTEGVYDEVLPFFDKCAPWEIKRDDVHCKKTFKRSVWGHPCVTATQTFDENQCVLRGCEGGYYLNQERNKCLKMPKEYNILGDIRNIVIVIMIFFFMCCFCCCFGIFCCVLSCCCVSLRCMKKDQEILNAMEEDGGKKSTGSSYSLLPQCDDEEDDDNMEFGDIINSVEEKKEEEEESEM